METLLSLLGMSAPAPPEAPKMEPPKSEIMGMMKHPQGNQQTAQQQQVEQLEQTPQEAEAVAKQDEKYPQMAELRSECPKSLRGCPPGCPTHPCRKNSAGRCEDAAWPRGCPPDGCPYNGCAPGSHSEYQLVPCDLYGQRISTGSRTSMIRTTYCTTTRKCAKASCVFEPRGFYRRLLLRQEQLRSCCWEAMVYYAECVSAVPSKQHWKVKSRLQCIAGAERNRVLVVERFYAASGPPAHVAALAAAPAVCDDAGHDGSAPRRESRLDCTALICAHTYSPLQRRVQGDAAIEGSSVRAFH
eukprot:GEMP01059245.1.p1 GENE.GEMP01059245.1~~GEMP01059245.1.p1  ORF type:complete len:300 (+),score=54.08 GEMP01059245.1:115-1014(+)